MSLRTHFLRVACFALMLALSGLAPRPLAAEPVVVPPEGQCPPYPVKPGEDAPIDDVVPPYLNPGEVIEFGGVGRLERFLPPEVWARRDTFFYEGMQMTIGPCHRRFPEPAFFVEATKDSKARIDEAGNLHDYLGVGLPFVREAIDRDDPQAGRKWAWNLRYRYQGAGVRGDFRIHLLSRRGRKVERFWGDFYLLNMSALPGSPADNATFWAGGRFVAPPVSRGVAWRQLRKPEADVNPERSDDIWVYVPDERRTRRAPPTAVDGLFMPSFTRGQLAGAGKLNLPDGTSTPDASIGVVEHTRTGFTALFPRPNVYAFEFVRTQDVLAPINSVELGYPAVKERSYGPSGQSLASDTWDIRRAVVIRGKRFEQLGKIDSMELYVDALTAQPLYAITHRSNGHLVEVGIMMGRFSGDDGVHTEWAGSSREFGAILPVAASFYVSGEGGWLRESFELRFDPPEDKVRRESTSVIPLQKRGR